MDLQSKKAHAAACAFRQKKTLWAAFPYRDQIYAQRATCVVEWLYEIDILSISKISISRKGGFSQNYPPGRIRREEKFPGAGREKTDPPCSFPPYPI